MSFKRIAATQNPVTPATIVFLWSVDKLFNSVSIRTTYRANMVKDGNGESQLDDIAVSSQEKDIFKEFLEDALYEMSTAMFKLTDGVDSSIVFDKLSSYFEIDESIVLASEATEAAAQPAGPGYDPLYKVTVEWGGFTVGTYVHHNGTAFEAVLPLTIVGFSILDNKSFNANVLPSLSKKMENCLKYFVLREWYGSTGLANDAAAQQAMYLQNFVKFKYLTFQLRKPLMT